MILSEGKINRPCPRCTDEQKKAFGCQEDTDDKSEWIVLDGEDIKRCPYRLVGRKEMRIVQATGLIESSILPDAGGWLDQASCFVKAACIVSAAKTEARKDAE